MEKYVIDRISNFIDFPIRYGSNVEDFINICKKRNIESKKVKTCIEYIVEQYINNSQSINILQKFRGKKYLNEENFDNYMKNTMNSYFGNVLNINYNNKDLLCYFYDNKEYEEVVNRMILYIVKNYNYDVNSRVKNITFLEYAILKGAYRIISTHLYSQYIKEKYDFFAKNVDGLNFFEYLYKYSSNNLIYCLTAMSDNFLPKKIKKQPEKIKEVYSIALNLILSDIELNKERVRYEKDDDAFYYFYLYKRDFAEFVIKNNIDCNGEKLFEFIEKEKELRKNYKESNEKEENQELLQNLNQDVVEKEEKEENNLLEPFPNFPEDKKILISRIDKILQVKTKKKDKTEDELEEIDLFNKFKLFLLEEQPKKTLHLKQ